MFWDLASASWAGVRLITQEKTKNITKPSRMIWRYAWDGVGLGDRCHRDRGAGPGRSWRWPGCG